MIFWMTGLSGSGKSTIATGVAQLRLVEVLEGDQCRRGLCKGLGYSPRDRQENLRRIAHLAACLSRHTDVLVACITPYESARQMVRSICGEMRLVYVKASVEVCRRRDPKGLYARADRGELPLFTGVGDVFEPPQQPDLVLDTENETPEQSIERLLRCVRGREHAYSLFIGRWQPFHLGHEHIIRKELAKGKKVAVAVRDTPLSQSDPFPTPVRLAMIRAVFAPEVACGDVVVFPMVDIDSVIVGRGVGYNVRSSDVPDTMAGVSSTEIRRRMTTGGPWQELVPAPVAELLGRLPQSPLP